MDDILNCIKLHPQKLLPSDLEYHIFDWFGCEDLAILSRVSKTQDQTIRKYLTQTPIIYLSRSHRYLHEFWMGAYSLDLVLLYCKNLKKIHFDVSDSLLQQVVIPNQKLTSTLRSKMEKWIERLILCNSKTLEVVSGNLENWISPMAIVELSECEKLKTLIERTDEVPPGSVPESFCVSAVELALAQCSEIRVFETTAVSFVKTCELLQNSSCLEQLTTLALPELNVNDAKTETVSKFFNFNLPNMKNLTDLTLSIELSNKRMWSSFHATIRVISAQLVEFTVNNTAHSPLKNVCESLEWNFPALREIQFSNRNMDTEKLDRFPTIVAPKLNKMWAKLNSKDAKIVSQNCPRLTQIIIEDPDMYCDGQIEIKTLTPLDLTLLETSYPVVDIENLSSFSKIQSINLAIDRKCFSLVSFLSAISSCPLLNNIKIFNCSASTPRPVEDWDNVKQVLCPGIMSIHTSECSDEFLERLNCPNLINFEMQSDGCNQVQRLDKFLVKCPKLEALDVMECLVSFQRDLLPKLEHLNHLTFHDCKSLTTLQVRDFLASCPALLCLRISKCSLVTEMILMYLTRTQTLCTLEISDLDPILPVKRLATILLDIAAQNTMLKYILVDSSKIDIFEHPPGIFIDKIPDVYATISDTMSTISSDDEETDLEEEDVEMDEDQDE